eukprot:scaffold644_cov168-Ochromonas_danica.AAC.10
MGKEKVMHWADPRARGVLFLRYSLPTDGIALSSSSSSSSAAAAVASLSSVSKEEVEEVKESESSSKQEARLKEEFGLRANPLAAKPLIAFKLEVCMPQDHLLTRDFIHWLPHRVRMWRYYTNNSDNDDYDENEDGNENGDGKREVEQQQQQPSHHSLSCSSSTAVESHGKDEIEEDDNEEDEENAAEEDSSSSDYSDTEIISPTQASSMDWDSLFYNPKHPSSSPLSSSLHPEEQVVKGKGNDHHHVSQENRIPERGETSQQSDNMNNNKNNNNNNKEGILNLIEEDLTNPQCLSSETIVTLLLDLLQVVGIQIDHENIFQDDQTYSMILNHDEEITQTIRRTISDFHDPIRTVLSIANHYLPCSLTLNGALRELGMSSTIVHGVSGNSNTVGNSTTTKRFTSKLTITAVMSADRSGWSVLQEANRKVRRVSSSSATIAQRIVLHDSYQKYWKKVLDLYQQVMKENDKEIHPVFHSQPCLYDLYLGSHLQHDGYKPTGSSSGGGSGSGSTIIEDDDDLRRLLLTYPITKHYELVPETISGSSEDISHSPLPLRSGQNRPSPLLSPSSSAPKEQYDINKKHLYFIDARSYHLARADLLNQTADLPSIDKREKVIAFDLDAGLVIHILMLYVNYKILYNKQSIAIHVKDND